MTPFSGPDCSFCQGRLGSPETLPSPFERATLPRNHAHLEPRAIPPAPSSPLVSLSPVLCPGGRKGGKLVYLQLELFCLQLSFFAYSPLRRL